MGLAASGSCGLHIPEPQRKWREVLSTSFVYLLEGSHNWEQGEEAGCEAELMFLSMDSKEMLDKKHNKNCVI